MSQYPQHHPWQPARPHELEYGADTRVVASFFNIVYAWMAVGLALTGLVAWVVAQNAQLMNLVYASRGTYVVLGLGAFAIAMGVQWVGHRISPVASTALFLLYAAILGALLAGIFHLYPRSTIFGAFLMTGGVFGGMSVYGFITKRDLSRMGAILIMCAWGLLLASVVNVWLARSDLVSWIITYAVLAVFIGITAYETQRLKEVAYATQGDPQMASRYAIVGALRLYISFINIFLSILRIMGDRR
jgi:FtsH-binding integral membrane protein